MHIPRSRDVEAYGNSMFCIKKKIYLFGEQDVRERERQKSSFAVLFPEMATIAKSGPS